jgi:hypothetical protein
MFLKGVVALAELVIKKVVDLVVAEERAVDKKLFGDYARKL